MKLLIYSLDTYDLPPCAATFMTGMNASGIAGNDAEMFRDGIRHDIQEGPLV